VELLPVSALLRVIGPHAGRKALTLYSVPPVEAAPNNPLLTRLAGFSLHAATVCEAHQRSRLERLCRYSAKMTNRVIDSDLIHALVR
jgi:hypothetical protein